MSNNNTVVVPQLAWSGDIEAELTFPDSWDVIPCLMKGHDSPRLSDEGFRMAFDNPIGTRPIHELARGKKNVVITFDDLSRPTRASEIVPFILEELLAGGMDESNIQFICALGCHGALTAADFRKKLGADVVARFNVYNHNPYENCTYIGKTRRGTPVSINTEFMNADLKIGIGSIVPHSMSGFGGGAKIVSPGVASIETIDYNHAIVPQKARDSGVGDKSGFGVMEDNGLLSDIQETCQMSGLHVKVDAILNIHRDTVALYVGEPLAEFHEGVKQAREHYLTPRPQDAEVIVANANAKVNECLIALLSAQPLLPDEGGTFVLISNNPYGEVPHYLRRSFGDHIGGREYQRPTLSPKVKKFIFLMPYMDKASIDWLIPGEAVTWARTWDEVMTVLMADHPHGCRVGVVPDGTIQYFSP